MQGTKNGNSGTRRRVCRPCTYVNRCGVLTKRLQAVLEAYQTQHMMAFVSCLLLLYVLLYSSPWGLNYMPLKVQILRAVQTISARVPYGAVALHNSSRTLASSYGSEEASRGGARAGARQTAARTSPQPTLGRKLHIIHVIYNTGSTHRRKNKLEGARLVTRRAERPGSDCGGRGGRPTAYSSRL